MKLAERRREQETTTMLLRNHIRILNIITKLEVMTLGCVATGIDQEKKKETRCFSARLTELEGR